MATRECPCCNDSVELLLSLPCHPEHRLCRRCLEKQTVPIADSIKCPECRERTAWLKPELLIASDGEIPPQQTCSPCRNNGKPGEVAEFFCQDCQNGMCAECNQKHLELFKLNSKHASVEFSEYRKKADLLTQRCCERVGHESEVLALVCVGCRTKGCLRCLKDACNCNKAMQTIEDALTSIRIELVGMQSKLNHRADKVERTVKRVQESMEEIRQTSENVIAKVNLDHTEKAAKLEEERDINIARVKGQLEQCAEDVMLYLERSKDAESVCRNLAESIPPLLDFTHPAHLIDITGEVSDVVQAAIDQPMDEPVTMSKPAYIPGCNGRSPAIVFPLKQTVKFTRNVRFDEGDHCYSCDVDYHGNLYHEEDDYFKNSSGTKYLRSICRLVNGDRFTLEADDSLNRYVENSLEPGIALLQKVSSFKVNKSSIIRRFVVTDAQIIVAGGDTKKIYIHDRVSGAVISEVVHPQLVRPVGLCKNGTTGDIIYCTDIASGSLFKFELSDTTAVTKLYTGMNYPMDVAFYQGLLYVLSDKGFQLIILTQQGELLNTIDVPGAKGVGHDIRINNNGLVVIANRDHGIQVYQLSPLEYL